MIQTTSSAPAEQIARFSVAALQKARRTARRRTVKAYTVGIVSALILLTGWDLLPRLGIADKAFVSSPGQVLTEFGLLVQEPSTWRNVWDTLLASVLAMIIGSVSGIFCAVLFWRFPAVRRGLSPLVTVLNALPRPALAPLFIMWFGLGTAPKVLVGASVVFFVLLLNTLAGFQNVQPDIRTLSDSYGIGPWRRLLVIELPAALPAIIAGFRLGSVYAVLGVVVSEIVASYYGLGQMLVQATNTFDVSRSFAILVFTAFIATAFDLVISALERVTPGNK